MILQMVLVKPAVDQGPRTSVLPLNAQLRILSDHAATQEAEETVRNCRRRISPPDLEVRPNFL